MNYKKNIAILFLSLTFILSGCRSSKTIVEGDKNYKLSAKQLIKENAKKEADFKTLQSKLKITYAESGKQQAHTVSYRMKKDEVIWISATFGIIRAKITPEKVSFYNKLDKTYFEGNFEYFSKLLGTNLDYTKIQNLLLGEALFNLKDEAYKISIHEKNYALQPKKQRDLFEIFFLLNPSHYKVTSQQISQFTEQRHLQIDYLSHQEIDKEILPEHIKVIAVERSKEMIAELEFKSVTLNDDLRFPFKVPSGFKEIKL